MDYVLPQATSTTSVYVQHPLSPTYLIRTSTAPRISSEHAIMPCYIIADSRAWSKGAGFVLSNLSNSWILRPLPSVYPCTIGLNTHILRELLSYITLLDFKTLLPEYVHISDGKGHDGKMANTIPIPAGSIVVADRGYADTALLNSWDSTQVSFVVRHQKTLKYEVIQELKLPEHGHKQILVDQIVRLTGVETQDKYTKSLRHIAVYNEQHGDVVELLTNIDNLAASSIASLYRSRWLIEIFFRNFEATPQH